MNHNTTSIRIENSTIFPELSLVNRITILSIEQKNNKTLKVMYKESDCFPNPESMPIKPVLGYFRSLAFDCN